MFENDPKELYFCFTCLWRGRRKCAAGGRWCRTRAVYTQYIIMLRLGRSTMETSRENTTLLTCYGLFCVVLLIGGRLTFQDLSIMQGGIKHMNTRHVHAAHQCLCPSNHNMPKHTSSNPARVTEVYRAWVQFHTNWSLGVKLAWAQYRLHSVANSVRHVSSQFMLNVCWTTKNTQSQQRFFFPATFECVKCTCSPLVDRFPTDTASVRKPSRTTPVSPHCSQDHTLILVHQKEKKEEKTRQKVRVNICDK